MKKISLARRNALLTPAGISWGAAALAFVAALALLRLIAPGFVLALAAPAFGAGSWTAAVAQNAAAAFASKAALVRENEDLAAQNAALSLENRALVEKTADVSKLAGPGIVAGVVARPPESPYDTLVIGTGSAGGVTAGESVFGPGGIPLGAVSSVTASFARVTLFSASGIVTNAWLGAARTPLTLVGQGGGAFSATIPRAAGAAVGDTVFAGGPGALPIGTVARADGDPASPTLVLRIVPALNLFSLTWVRVSGGTP